MEYVFSNPQPKVTGGSEVTDARNVSARVMHSFIKAPDNDYQPRFDDARLGFFGQEVTDLTSTEAAPYRDMINRWHLVKKDPNAALSEPVEPITWWIENTTPVEWRELIRSSALEWNSAFEKAGFKNALVVNIQPDDAEWDAGDIRYNVLRWTSSPGPYDDWLIERGYSPALAYPQAEKARLDAILARSTEPELAFGNDADDMRSPGKAIDPRVNIYDMSSDPVTYASNAMTLMKNTLDGMGSRRPEDGKSYEEIFEGTGVMLSFWGRSAAVVSRYIGGVYVDRAVVGQQGATAPFRPVKTATQKRAMDVLAQQVFAPNAFTPSAELLSHSARQRRGFNHFEATEDPKIHDAILAIQTGVLDHLMHPVVMKRITDSSLYGNGYSLASMVTDLTDAVFEADARDDVNSMRQNLQMAYVQRLAKIVKGGYDTPSQSMAVYSLNEINELLDRRRSGNTATQAHTQNMKLTIERALDTST